MGDTTQIVAGRDSILYSEPFNTANDFPGDDAVPYGTAWGGSWVNRGYTQNGIEVDINAQRAEIKVDQELDPVLRPMQSRGFMLKTSLAQMSANNLLVGFGQGSVTTVAAGAGTRGHDDYKLTSTVSDTYYSWGLDVKNPGDSEAIRTLIYKGLSTGSIKTTWGKAEANADIPIEITAIPDSSVSPARIAGIRDVIAAN